MFLYHLASGTGDEVIQRNGHDDEVIELTHSMGISGVPVVDGKRTVGIVTGRDLRFETRMEAPVSEVMTPKARLVTVGEGASDDEVKSLLHQHRIEKVLVVDDNDELKGMITAKDFQKADAIRDQLAEAGVVIEDGPGGTTWRRGN